MALQLWPRGKHDWLVRPVGYAVECSQGILLSADTEEEAWRVARELYGEIESLTHDDIG